ncbi:MAG: nucleotidyltransferase domain-containing protein [Anaerolineales bacterium]|nr:nucleotidyltransferase domain-containing protein [Anaerolineales bacterium]
MTLKYHPILSTFQAEREALQKQIIATLQNDKRIVAAWLFGSLGRGTADALSDIDIWLVVADTFIQDIVAHRQQFVAQIQDPAFFVEAPQNAPQDGGYLMAYYDMPTGPHQVDWYWQPQSLAYIPAEAIVLFDHIGLPHHELPVTFPRRDAVKEITETPLHFISYFWAMLLINAKYIMRRPEGEELRLLPYALHPFNKAQYILDQEQAKIDMPQTTYQEKLSVLRCLASEMCEIMPKIAALGEAVPNEAPRVVCKYLDIIEEASA